MIRITWHLIEDLLMRKLLVAFIFISPAVFAQELTTFNTGETADAEAVFL